VCRVPDLRDNISPNAPLHREPGLRDTIAIKRLCAMCQCCVTIFTPRTSLYRVPGLHDTIALKHLCAAWQIYVTILPVKRLYTVSMGYVTKML